jgi:enoyl-CoA hydratase/carnithine racemase
LVIASGIKGIFCSGGNLKYWPRAYPGAPDRVSDAGRKVFARIERFIKPSIAAIDGRVIGDGLSPS